MPELICGIFPNRQQAEQARGALIGAGFSRADVGVPPKSVEGYEEQAARGATRVAVYADDGPGAVAIMLRNGATRVSRAQTCGDVAASGARESGVENTPWQPSSADVSMSAIEDTKGAYPGWEPGGPGVTGLVPQEHEDGAVIPTVPEE